MYNFSVIIPHRNSSNLLSRCLDSIPLRDDLQIIIVDDNSNRPNLENLKEIVESRKNVELISLVGENGGAGHARNVGLIHATGEWILFSDCDDEYSPDMNIMMDNYLYSDCDIVYYDFIYKYDRNESGPICSKKLMNEDRDENKDDFLKYRILAPWNKMVRKSLIINNNIKFEECSNGNDIFYSFQVGFFAKNICFFPRVIYHYYRNVSGITKKSKNDDSYYLCLFEHIYECNMFYRNIGHKSWCRSVFVEIIAIIYRQGLRASIQAANVYIKNKKRIKESRNKYVDFFFKS